MSQGFIHTSESITATNGLTKTAGNITLGGALSTNTTISGSYTLSFTNTSVSIATGIFSTQTTFNFATASTVPYFDASKNLISSAVTPTELGLLSGITGFTGSGTLIAKGTSPTFTTDITTPLIIGGSAVGSQLTLKGTSANGTSTVAAIVGNVGNNGATNAFNVYNSGQFNIGNYASPTNLRIFTVGQDTGFVSIGSLVGATSYGALYFDQTSPSVSNYALIGSGSETMLNATTNLYLRINNTSQLAFTTSTAIFSPSATSSGATTSFTFTAPNNTNQTLSTAIPKFLVTLGSTQWATGALAATQNFFSITQPTISFVGASTATLVATVGIAGAPIQGTNATNTTSVGLLIEAGAITGATTSYGAYFNAQTGGSTNYALGLAGDLRFPTGNATISGSNGITILSSSGSNIAINAGSASATCAIIYAQGTERFRFNTGTATSGAITVMTVTPGTYTGQTASTEVNGYLYNSYSKTWAAGAITTQREHYLKTVTYAFASASTITSAYALYVERATVGSNATITTNFGIGTNGIIQGLSYRPIGYTQTFLADQTGTGILETQFVANGGVSLASTSAAQPVGFKIGGTGGAEVFRASGQTSSGATNQFIFSGSVATGQTASTEISGVLHNSYSRTWAAGAITTQREQYIKTVTYAFASASTITNAYGLYVEAPTAGSNATITNNYALGLSGGSLGLATGTTTIAPLRFTSGTNLTVAEAGAMEYDGSNLYFTNSTPTRILLTQSFPMGETYMTGNATATTIASSGVYYKVSGTTTLSHAHEFTAGGTDNRLTYTGTITKMFHVACTLSVKSAGSNDIIYARIAKNGTTIPAGTVQQKLGSIGDVASTAIHVVVELATNDYIELFVMNNSGTSSLTITDMNMFGMGIYH